MGKRGKVQKFKNYMTRMPTVLSTVETSENIIDVITPNDITKHETFMDFQDLSNFHYKTFIVINISKKLGLNIRFNNTTYPKNKWPQLIEKVKTTSYFGIIFMNIPNKNDETYLLNLLYQIIDINPKRQIDYTCPYTLNQPYYKNSFNMVSNAYYLGIWFPKLLLLSNNGMDFIKNIKYLHHKIQIDRPIHDKAQVWMNKNCKIMSSMFDVMILSFRVYVLMTIKNDICIPVEIWLMICKYLEIGFLKEKVLPTEENLTHAEVRFLLSYLNIN